MNKRIPDHSIPAPWRILASAFVVALPLPAGAAVAPNLARDGITDVTVALQSAMDDASRAGGGVIDIPPGQYNVEGNLRIPRGVTLRGTYVYAPAHAGVRDGTDDKPTYGTVLLARAGAGAETGIPFVTIEGNAALQGVTVYYPDQKPDAQEPVPYPYAVALRGNNPALLDVQLLNPYNGIDASKNQRALIRNVHGQPLHVGLFVDDVYDIGRIENVHWNPWWSINSPVYRWQTNNGTGFVFARTDWHYVLNTFCYGYKIGYQFRESERGVCNGNFLGIGADACQTAVQIDASARFGILITNGEFVAFEGPEPTMVRVSPSNRGSVRFVNCAFWGPCHRIAVIEGRGTIGFSDCTFTQWGHRGGPGPVHAIEARNGSIVIRGCEFQEDKPQVAIGDRVERAIVTENLIVGEIRVDYAPRSSIVVRDNVTAPPP